MAVTFPSAAACRARAPVACALRAAVAGLAVLACLLATAQATAAPAFSSQATAACVSRAEAATPSRSGHAVLDCVGLSAQACMAKPGGDTTIGMRECLEAEHRYWDGRLNAAYAARMARSRAEDREMNQIRATTLPVEDALRGMQRAWIAFRDAACLHEFAQWRGGTGSGPATAACHLHETARQALRLEGWWAQ
jgi:uncharacterized protein YecT (DUF1311 family)